MGKIKVLDKETVDKIAAGEVVERPVAVIKELVENSIDAGSGEINIEIAFGGIRYMRVSDNGCGIEKDDLNTAFLRHATSKINNIDDLYNLYSLGFRGEALSSISAVSKLEIISRTENEEVADKLTIHGGKIIDLKPVSSPIGTTVIVQNLFYNTPVRRKFLKSPQSESTAITEMVEKLALSRPEISFKLIVDGKTKVETGGSGELKNVIYEIYGRNIYKNLIPVDFEISIGKVKGFIGKPVAARGTRKDENIFINRRYVKSNSLNYAIEEAYKSFLMQRKFPFFVLFLEVNTDSVDVNVHPSKMEVKFDNEKQLKDEIYGNIRFILSDTDLVIREESSENRETINNLLTTQPVINNFAPEKEQFVEKPQKASISAAFYEPEIKSTSESAIPVKKEYENIIVNDFLNDENREFQQQCLFKEEEVDNVKIIGQIFNTYWIIEKNNEAFIIDQHAAHEKVNYERILKEFDNEEPASQLLSPSIILTLNPSEIETLKNYNSYFRKLGFEISEFGGRDYAITAVPMYFYNLDVEELFISLLAELDNKSDIKNMDYIKNRIATIACKASIKGGQDISIDEVKALFNEMLTLDMPYNCPHGRPTMISITKYELEKKFKRIV